MKGFCGSCTCRLRPTSLAGRYLSTFLRLDQRKLPGEGAGTREEVCGRPRQGGEYRSLVVWQLVRAEIQLRQQRTEETTIARKAAVHASDDM